MVSVHDSNNIRIMASVASPKCPNSSLTLKSVLISSCYSDVRGASTFILYSASIWALSQLSVT